jgi:hypothetical protein
MDRMVSPRQLAPGRPHVPACNTPPGGMTIHVQVVDVLAPVKENGGHVAVTLSTKYAIDNIQKNSIALVILTLLHIFKVIKYATAQSDKTHSCA